MSKCLICGGNVPLGQILCPKCDKPRRPKSSAASAQPAAPPTQGPPRSDSPSSHGAAAAIAVADPEPFPKAPIVPFPVGTSSLAITSIVDLIVATGVPAILIGADRNVKFVSESAAALFQPAAGDISSIQSIESKAGVRVADLSTPASAGLRIGDRSILYSLVPLSGGASGAVLVFRYADTSLEASAPFTTYVREAVIDPLKSLRDVLTASAERSTDPIISDATATIEQILSSIELAPGVSERIAPKGSVATVTEVVRRVSKRFDSYAELKGIRLQVDSQQLPDALGDHERLFESLGILVENAIHYVPRGGQIVIGVRTMEHKGKPLLLFFVMDNGPLVPESMRHAIFESGFVWDPASDVRTGRGLHKVREFATNHGGSVWAESRTGKACTFFVRVRPDGV